MPYQTADRSFLEWTIPPFGGPTLRWDNFPSIYYRSIFLLSSIIRSELCIQQAAITSLATHCDGDARSALNTLQVAAEAKSAENDEITMTDGKIITVDDITDALQRSHVQYDKTGEWTATAHRYYVDKYFTKCRSIVLALFVSLMGNFSKLVKS